MGRVGREHDYPPFRAMGPVTEIEYKSRVERYDDQLRNIIGVEPDDLTMAEKMSALRKYRESQYELLLDAVYKRRGWDMNSIPTLEKVRELGIDLPEVTHEIERAIGIS
jgi:aldehyde:ferredoxin oxidoreductase